MARVAVQPGMLKGSGEAASVLPQVLLDKA
jgi:hypothetical protein